VAHSLTVNGLFAIFCLLCHRIPISVGVDQRLFPSNQMPLKTNAAFALYIVVAGTMCAQTSVTTDPVGFTTTSCLSSSDTYVGIPFTRPPEFSGTIQSISGSTITLNGSPGWANNQFVYSQGTQPKHYYVLLGNGGASNPKEGHIYPVAGNGSNTLTVDATTQNLSGVTANTQITLIPYWTPATVFPASDVGVSFTPTGSPPAYQTLLRMPNYSAPGINQPYAAEYYFNNGSWQRVNPAGVGDDDPLLPDGYFIVRNDNGAPTLPLTAAGSVLMKKLAVPLLTSRTQQQDNAIVMIRPVDVPLVSTGLAPIDESFTESDQLLLFGNTQRGFNKTPSAIYVFSDGWKLSTDLTTDHGNDLIPSGSALIVRKGATTDGTVFSNNSPTYPGPVPITPLQVASRKQHGNARFNLNLPNIPAPSIECRLAGPNASYTLVYTFDRPVTSADNATVTQGIGNQPTISPGPNPNQLTVNLTGVSNVQHLIVSLNGVHNTLGQTLATVSSTMDVLVADTNGDGSVNSIDSSQTKSRSGFPLTNLNYRSDVNVDGSINSIDTSLVKSKSGTGLGPN
jgi:uncharacterized protein (TIGR02597 family)